MIKNMANLEVLVGEWKANFILAHETPIDICKEMVFQLQKHIAAIEDQIKAVIAKQEEEKQQQQEAEDVTQEEDKVVEIEA